jgi:hypothetical protein
MKGATCHFCSRSFRNRQAVRAHLKSCAGYRQLPKAALPSVGGTPGTPGSRGRYPDVGPIWKSIPDANPPRSQTPRTAAGTGRKTTPTGLARWMIQSVKDEVIGKWRSQGHIMPSETKAQALMAIERELSTLPIDQLPRSELVTVAEGIRDRYYRPVMQAEQRAREQAERMQNQARQRTALIAAGMAHANRALRQQPNLDGLTRLDLEQKVKQALEQDIDGSEGEVDVQALVTQTIERELKPLQKQAREKARQLLIAHGIAYAKGALDWKEDLEAWERSEIERDVKQALHQEITGEESKDDVDRRVDEILDEILTETDAEDDEDEGDEGEEDDDEGEEDDDEGEEEED